MAVKDGAEDRHARFGVNQGTPSDTEGRERGVDNAANAVEVMTTRSVRRVLSAYYVLTARWFTLFLLPDLSIQK